ncbi:hypothetical protein GQ457_06G000910 [Hibiscus cannabinus]
MAAIASILVAGAIGVCFPLLGKTIKALRPEKNLFFIIKAFATKNLTSPCLNENLWGKFPFAGLVAMTASIGTLMVDVLATSHYINSHLQKTQQSLHGDQENTGENEIHLSVHTHADSTQLVWHLVVSQVLELGDISGYSSVTKDYKTTGGCTHLSSIL